MRITVPVALVVTVELDMDDQDRLSIEQDTTGRLGDIADSSRAAILEALQGRGVDELLDRMVDAVTDATGWCVSGLSMKTG